jgi:hypothetical protein
MSEAAANPLYFARRAAFTLGLTPNRAAGLSGLMAKSWLWRLNVWLMPA